MPNRVSLAELYPRISKPRSTAERANLADYQRVRDSFTWEAARSLLDGLPGGHGLNIAHEAVDRHAVGPRAEREALRWIGSGGERRAFTYRDLKVITNRFANALRGLGVIEGDGVFVLAGRIPELYVAVLGALMEGELALKAGWPSMMRGYLNEDVRYRKCFVGEWYLTGDLAMRDADGYYWFVGRADDVIKSFGHLIGPFEVESAFMEHLAVAEAGVIGKPDPMAGEIVKAFISLNPGFIASDTLRRELRRHARKRLGAVVAPKEIDFSPGLRRTRSGKIMRRLLKARELGLPEGDLSTLESDTR